MDADAVIKEHYGKGDLVSKVVRALEVAGLGSGTVDWRLLSPLDQFHVGGMEATADLAHMLEIRRHSRGLDVGCGLGGPARYLAATYGCQVTGLDLSEAFVQVASLLTRRTGFEAAVSHLAGDATALPFEPKSFDFAWTQHVAMNIANRRAFYAGIFRVLRPGGRLALYDAVAGEGGEVIYPVPWSPDERGSFLLSGPGTRAALEEAGFVVRMWRDATDVAFEWRREQQAAISARAVEFADLALPLVMGGDFVGMGENFQRNLRERRVRLLQVVAERPL